jgi:hypothetical protein
MHMSETPTQPENTRPVKLVYLGYGILKSDKLGHRYAEIEADGILSAKTSIFSKELILGRVGLIFDTFETLDGSKVSGPRIRAGYWPDEQQVAVWQAESRTNQAVLRDKKNEKKEDGRNLLFESLETAKRAYNALPYSQRRFLLADIIRYITD